MHAGQVIAKLENEPMKTIRVIECALLHESNTRCSPCREFRRTLNALKAAKRFKSEIKACTNYRWLTKEQLSIQLKSARTIISHHEKVILQLKQEEEEEEQEEEEEKKEGEEEEEKEEEKEEGFRET